MSTYSIAARVTLSGDGVSSDGINISELNTYSITQPTVESGAVTIKTANANFSTFDGTHNSSARLLYVKNTGLSTDGTITFSVGGSTSASTFITVYGDPTADQTITLISSDGTSKTYIAKDAENVASLQFKRTGTDAEVATSLEACIEASTGHAGKIVVDNDGAGTLRLTQATKGLAGNTVVTSNLANVRTGNFLNATVTSENFATIKPGEWITIPIAANAIVNTTATADAPCEYGWYRIV
tara:strand:+ start:361 stop:1083 length:723 start_codon:yes stop_codon:yes gene_type:complete